MIARYPTVDDFRKTYNASSLVRWATSEKWQRWCMVTPNSPTLGMIIDAYGEDAAIGWLSLVLSNINRYLNLPKDKEIDEGQLQVLAISWIAEYKCLKCSEVWVFLLKLFAGKYGQQVYGSINPIGIGAALDEYIASRRREEAKWLKEQEQLRREQQVKEYEANIANLKTLRESEAWKRMPLEERGKLADFLTRFVSPDYADDEAQAALKKKLTENTSDKKNTNDNTK